MPPEGGARASALSGTLNLANTLLGGGISFIALPFATKRAGSVAGVLLLIVASAACNTFTCMLLVLSARLTGVSTYGELASQTLGHKWKHVLTAFIFLNNFCV